MVPERKQTAATLRGWKKVRKKRMSFTGGGEGRKVWKCSAKGVVNLDDGGVSEELWGTSWEMGAR